MRRTVTEVLRRGFENTIANWPLLLIRLAENILFIIMIVVAAIAVVVPIAVSLGVSKFDPSDAQSAADLMASILIEQWPALLYVFVVIVAVLTVFVAVHSFVESGSARVYVDAEAMGSRVSVPSRRELRAFTMDRWMAGGRQGWWRVFWIYNIAWSVASLIILVPVIILLGVMILMRENPGGMAAIGCAGGAVSLLFVILVATVTNIWCQKAIIICVARAWTAMTSLGAAWREFAADAGRHIAVALILFLLTIVGTFFFMSISAFSNIDSSATFQLVTMPLQLASSLLSSIFSLAMTGWFLACFAALTTEMRSR